MDKPNEMRLEHILSTMAATIKNDESNKYKPYMRKHDCYTYVAKSLKTYYDNPLIDKCRIVVYSIGKELGHCVMKDPEGQIVADDFKEARTFYNPKTGRVVYNDENIGSEKMSSQYKLDHNSFEINVKDFKKLFVDNLDLILERGQKLKSEQSVKRGEIIESLNNGESIPEIEIKHLGKENPLAFLKKITDPENVCTEKKQDNKIKSSQNRM